MAIKMIEGLHLTAADKRDIAAVISNGWTRGVTKQKRYDLAPLGGNRYSVTLTKKESNDWGRAVSRVSKFVVEAA